MDEPVRYLAEETYRPTWLKNGVIESTVGTVLGLKQEIDRIGKELAHADRFYLIGSGGSYGVQFPVKYIAEKYTDIPVHQYSGWDYLERMPTAAREGAVCIFISHSGKTSELVKALERTKVRGATTVGIAQEPGAPINRIADIGLGYGGSALTVGKLAMLYLLFGAILKEKGYDVGNIMVNLTDSLPGTLTSMTTGARASSRVLGLRYKDDNEMFVVGGGINWGLTYQFAICILQEMCWIHATPINYSEFRHGPIEMFSPGRAALFLRGRGSERELETTIIDWCMKNGVRSIVFDSQGMDVDNMLTPFTLLVETQWLGYYLSLARNRDMENWRYYDKIAW